MFLDNECGDSLKRFHNPLNRDVLHVGSEGQMMNRPPLSNAQQRADKLADQSAYREQQRQDLATIRELPADHPYPPVQTFAEWNGTRRDYLTEKCLHWLVEAQVERTPNAVAVIFEQEQLSYQQLDQRANQLAHYLQQQGVGPEVRVGLYVERSVEMLVGLLGILRAGGAYVPLDPGYPAERLAFMLTDAQTPILLTQEHLLNCLPAHQARVLCLDTDWQQVATRPITTPSSTVSPGNLAYVIYTSSSTGTPKGVMIFHKELANRIFAMTETYKLDASDRVLQFISLSFDASVEEIFPILTAGGTLIVYQKPTDSLVSELLFECEQLKVTLLHMPAAYWHQMVDELSSLQQNVPASVKTTIVGGESLSLESLVTWSRLAKHPSKFINVYGPTEATITSTFYETSLELAAVSKLKNVPIGRPLANTEIYVLDANLQPVPIGAPGELFIGAAELARGYLCRPELTAEKFIPHPFSSVSGARLYKTGDLARYLPDGIIEFLGRVDHQVKIRGYRIGLGEIESVLAQHPAVRQTVVVIREEISDIKYLVAYVIFHQEHIASASILQSYVSQHLPNYMVPSAFVFLDKLPLTPHGKIDRRALPAPEQTRPVLQSNFVAARTPLEEKISATWTQVLGIQQIGIHDNFFELGDTPFLPCRYFRNCGPPSRWKSGCTDSWKLQRLLNLRNYFSNVKPMIPLLESPPSGQSPARPIVYTHQVRKSQEV